MKKIVCSGFGHREFYGSSQKLYELLENMIVQYKVTTFWTGGMGDFDSEMIFAVKNLQRKYPFIELILIKPYFSNHLNTFKEYYERTFNDVIIPDVLSGCHPKAAITKRNRWIIENSDYIVFNIHRDFGGAFTALKYAKQLKKEIFML